jgi:hypothetical protein
MSFGDGFIDASLYELDEELNKVDELLSNAQLLKPFEEAFDPSLDRPGTAVGIYLRMMYLKFRWGFRKEFRTFSCTSERACLKLDQKHSLIETRSLLGWLGLPLRGGKGGSIFLGPRILAVLPPASEKKCTRRRGRCEAFRYR